MAEPPPPPQAFTAGIPEPFAPSPKHPHLSGRYLSRVYTHLTGVSSFRRSGCLTRKHSAKAIPPPYGGQDYFRDRRSGERAAVAPVRGRGLSGLRGFRVRATRAGVAGVTGWRAVAVSGIFVSLRGCGACLRQAWGWDLRAGLRRLETGLFSPGAAAARRPVSSSRCLAAALTPSQLSAAASG